MSSPPTNRVIPHLSSKDRGQTLAGSYQAGEVERRDQLTLIEEEMGEVSERGL